MKKKKQGFFYGAAILAFAGVAVKVIGACYKIPLGNLLGPVGMADFSIAYNIYTLLFVLSTAGIPSAVSKMVSEAESKKDDGYAFRIYKVSCFTFAAVGMAGFSVMFFGADMLAELMGSKSAALSIKAISPAVMFVCISAINRGYFQGKSNMYPTAVSEILEALGKLLFGIAAAIYMRFLGFDSAVISAGAIFGVSVGAFLSALFFCFCREGKKDKLTVSDESEGKIIRKLFSLAIPITAGAAIISVGNVVDSALVMKLLQGSGFSEYRAKWLFGAYNYAVTLFNLPSVFTTTLAISAIPAISFAFAKGDKSEVNKLANSAMTIGMTVAFPAAFGLLALSEEVMSLLYGRNVSSLCLEASSLILGYLCFAIPFLTIVTVTNSIHQSLGSVHIPVISGALGVAVKIVSNILFVSRVEINILGAAISTVLCYGTIAAINVGTLKRYDFIKIEITKVFIKPFLPGVVSYVAAETASSLTRTAFGFCFSTVFSVFAGFLMCLVTFFAVGIVQVKGKSVYFGGKSISKFLNND